MRTVIKIKPTALLADGLIGWVSEKGRRVLVSQVFHKLPFPLPFIRINPMHNILRLSRLLVLRCSVVIVLRWDIHSRALACVCT